MEDVPKSLEFYEKAFGLNRRFLHESNSYAELETGETILAFASIELGKTHGPEFADLKTPTTIPPFEIALVTDNVQTAYQTAISHGAVAIQEPTQKPWGQLVGYVKDPNGFFVELCSPIHA